MSENPVHRQKIMERQIGNEHMLYDALGKVVHVVNESAYFIWQRCDGEHTMEEIAKEASLASGINEHSLRPDVEQCIAIFKQKGLLQDH